MLFTSVIAANSANLLHNVNISLVNGSEIMNDLLSTAKLYFNTIFVFIVKGFHVYEMLNNNTKVKSWCSLEYFSCLVFILRRKFYWDNLIVLLLFCINSTLLVSYTCLIGYRK